MGNCLKCFKEKKLYTDYEQCDQLYDHLNTNKDQYVTVFIESSTTDDPRNFISK